MAKFNAISPLGISFLLAGLLMFAVIGIVRSVTTPSQVGAMTEQGYQRINVANNIGAAVELPSYPARAELQPTNADQRPAIYSVSQNQPETLYNVTVIKEWDPATDGRRSYIEGGATFDNPGNSQVGQDNPVLWQDAMPSNPTWLTTVRDPNGWFWVWADAWFSCQHVDAANLTYASIRTDPALAAWGQLSMRKQSEVAAICKG